MTGACQGWESVKVVSERPGCTGAAMTLNVYSRLPWEERTRAAEPCHGGTVRLRVEFTTEPFDLDEAPAHAVVAREVIEAAELDAVDVGPFGNTAEGAADAVLGAVDALLRKSLDAGATRISLQVNVMREGGN